MRCSGCGKDIPFGGEVCPYCQRDKSGDQAYTVAAFVLGVAFAAMGYYVFGFWGALGGFVFGAFVAAVVVYSKLKSVAPEVRVQTASPIPAAASVDVASGSVSDRLKQLQELHAAGLISESEYAEKRREVLAKF